jgi:hypothetical protein
LSSENFSPKFNKIETKMSENIKKKRNSCKWCSKTDHLRKSSKLCSQYRLANTADNDIQQAFPKIISE